MLNEVDIVYTWVDGQDPNFENLIESYSPGILNKKLARYRNNNELKYSLRGVFHNINYRNIYIVTNGQRPDFINSSHPNIVFISHEQIFPDKNHLPTFNSLAIECHLHKIPGLADNFIYFNDDIFVCKKTEINNLLFHDLNGLIYLSNTLLSKNIDNDYGKILRMTEEIIALKYGVLDRYSITHTPQMFNKKTCYAVEFEWKELIKKTSESKFKNRENIFFRLLYIYFVIYERCGKSNIQDLVKNPLSGVIRPSKKIYQTISYPSNDKSTIESIILDPPLFLSIQDVNNSSVNTPNPIDFHLNKIFFKPAEWEIF